VAVMRIPSAVLALLFAPMSASAAFQDAPTERLVQFGLETLRSGARLSQPVDDGKTTLELRVLRTWKSKSGHYCRRYELRWRSEFAKTDRLGGVRCRDVGGGWKAVED